jgi:hypothetical protein
LISICIRGGDEASGVGSGPTVGGAWELLGTADDGALGATGVAAIVGKPEAGSGDGESSGLVQPARTMPATRRRSGWERCDVGGITRTQTSAERRV